MLSVINRTPINFILEIINIKNIIFFNVLLEKDDKFGSFEEIDPFKILILKKKLINFLY